MMPPSSSVQAFNERALPTLAWLTLRAKSFGTCNNYVPSFLIKDILRIFLQFNVRLIGAIPLAYPQ
jgi:hypothetical protein